MPHSPCPAVRADHPRCDHRVALPVRPREPTTEVIDALAHLYGCRGLSTRQIGALLEIDRQRVNRWLHTAGITVAARGHGRARPHTRRSEPDDFPALLTALYVHQRLTSARIGELLGIPERTVRTRLSEYGIRRRPRGGHDRDERLAVPRHTLIRLYVAGGMTAEEVAHRLDMSRATVLRTAHDLGLPVRTGGTPPAAGPAQIRLIEALYADPQVGKVLRAHGIPRVPAGGAIWQRFPVPLAPPSTALAELYVSCGVSTSHIELLTGIPSATVGRRLRECGVQSRPAGGRCPFLRRWRAAERLNRRASYRRSG